MTARIFSIACSRDSRLDALPVGSLFLGLLLLVVPAPSSHGQVTTLSETFEGNFPADNGWTVGDSNPAGTPAFWDDVHTSFGGEGTHGGSWKGYCAGVGYGSSAADPVYQDSMRAFMRRSIDLTGYAGAELRFWYKIPSMDDYREGLRVYVDSTVVYSRDLAAGFWSEAVLNLSDFVGASRLLSIEFSTDESVPREGCYLDDISVIAYANPPNNDFANASVLSGSFGFVNSFNNNASKENGEPEHAGVPNVHSVWFRWTAPSAASVNINTSGSSFDTVLAVYVGNSVATLTQVVGNDDINGGLNRQSRVRFTPVAGQTYWIAVDSYANATGSIRLSWQQLGVSDLIIYGPSASPSLSVVSFPDDSCEVVEHLIAPGTRKIVRFATEARNVGSADLLLGDPAGNPLFTPGVCHRHNHFNGFAFFRVRNNAGDVVANGNKVGFCLEDTFVWNGAPNPTVIFSCGFQGLQAGWSDTYLPHLPGQWVDITGLPAGNYILEQEINPNHTIEESNYGNNVTQVPFTIPPYSNDAFVNATRIGNDVTTVTGNNSSSTKEFNEPNHAGNAGGKSIWYCWTATISAGVLFDTIGSNFDTLLAVYTGNSISTLTLVVQNDDIDGAANRASRVGFVPTAGTTYWIAVDGYNAAVGSVVLNISPANNDFAACQGIAGTAGSLTGFNLGATTESGEPNHANTASGRSVWYCWTAPVSGLTEFNTVGSGFDTILAAYTGSSVDSLTEVVSNDDIPSPLSRQSRITFNAIAGTAYRIAVAGYAAESGTIQLNWGYKCRVFASVPAPAHFVVTIQGVPQQNYLIQTSDDFVSWLYETTISTDVFGGASYGLAAPASRRFYRAFPVP